jgi:uncharacterized protein (TIGR03437 family)
MVRRLVVLFGLLCFTVPAIQGASVSHPVHPRAGFERNTGQASPEIQYLARGRDFELALNGRGAEFTKTSGFTRSSLRMLLAGTERATYAGEDRLPGVVNYFIGSDPKAWRTSVPTYGRVRARGIYAGIDLLYYANDSELEYDFVVAPGADPRWIRMRFEGATAVRVDENGDLVLASQGTEFRERRPIVYQEGGGKRDTVEGRYELQRGGTVGFTIGAYDPRRRLVIDPILGYASLLGGNQDDHAYGVAVDVSGGAYVAGSTNSTNFPTAPAQPYQAKPSAGSTLNAFVSKISPDGKTLVYSTYLGGAGSQFAQGVAVDKGGNVYVAGSTSAKDFPTTSGLRTSYGGGTGDAFAAKLDPTGTKLLYSTYLGGSASDAAAAVAVDSAGNAYVAGSTRSADFPVTKAFQAQFGSSDPTLRDGFLTKIDASGGSIVYSTYLGGKAEDWIVGVAVDSSGAAIVAGNTQPVSFPLTPNALPNSAKGITGFVTRFAPDGGSLTFSSLLGKADFFDAEHAYAMALDPSGAVIIVGDSYSSSFPITPGVLQTGPGTSRFGVNSHVRPWAMKVNPVSATIVYSTYLGIQGLPVSVAADAAGDAYVVMDLQASSPEIPTKDATVLSNGITGVLLELNPVGTGLIYGTFTSIGNVYPQAVALDSAGSAYVAGWVVPSNRGVLITPGSAQTSYGGNHDATLIKLYQDTNPGLPRIDAITNAAGYQPGGLCPGEIVTIFGAGMAPDPLTGLQLDSSGKVATTLAGTRVLFDGVAMPLIYVSGSQISAIVPQGLDTSKIFTAVQIDNNGTKSLPVYVSITTSRPAIFTLNGAGTGQAAAINQDGTINGPDHPAPKGSIVILFGTGVGALSPIPLDGSVTGSVLGQPKSVVGATVGNATANILYAGPAPSLVAGVLQINLQIPDRAPSGAAPVEVTTDDFTNANVVTIAVQ